MCVCGCGCGRVRGCVCVGGGGLRGGVKKVAFLCIGFWWETATTPWQILVGHWLTVAPGDDSAGRDWQQILTLFDSVLVQSDWSISSITYSEIPGEKLGGKVLWYQFICCEMSRKG